MARRGSRPIDELVRLAMIGDGAAFTELWDTNIGSLKAFLRTWIKRVDDFYIDDICSRSFEKAFRQISSYDPAKSKFSTWLKTIARNTALDTLEQEGRARRKYVSLDDSTVTLPMVDQLGDDVDTPLESIIKEEDNVKTLACIEGLPEIYREIARKRMVDGLQYREIAEETGLELNTVRTRIRRAKAMMDKMKDNEN